jgi:hypothetical protein
VLSTDRLKLMSSTTRTLSIRALHPCGVASKNLEMNRIFALSSTPFGPLVQTAPQTSSIQRWLDYTDLCCQYFQEPQIAG